MQDGQVVLFPTLYTEKYGVDEIKQAPSGLTMMNSRVAEDDQTNLTARTDDQTPTHITPTLLAKTEIISKKSHRSRTKSVL